jgi:trigger factor
VEYPALEVRDEDVDASLNGVREQRAALQGVDRPAQEGDFVSIDYVVHVEGEEDQSGPMLRIAGSSDDPLDQAILGHSAGETFTVEAPLQSDPDRQGSYEITIKEVRNWVVPELDDDLAKQLGMESLDDLRTNVRERLQNQAAEMVKDDIEQRLLAAVREGSTLTYPSDLVDRMAAERMEGVLHELTHRRLSLEDYLEHEQKSLAELENELEAQARSIIESQLLLTEIAKAEDLKVTEAQLAEELGSETAEGGVTEDAAQRAANRVMYRNIITFLTGNNTLTPVGAPAGEGGNEPAGEDAGEKKEGGLLAKIGGRRKKAAKDAEAEGAEPPAETAETAPEATEEE